MQAEAATPVRLSSSRSPGKYCLKLSGSRTTPQQTPAVAITPSCVSSSGRYKLGSKEKESYSLAILTPPSTAEALAEIPSDISFEMASAFRKILIESRGATPQEEEQDMIARRSLWEHDQKRIEEIEKSTTRRSKMLKAIGDDKERLLRQYEEEDRRAEEEKVLKRSKVGLLLVSGSIAKIFMQEVEELLEFTRKYGGETEQWNELRQLRDSCIELNLAIAALKDSHDNKILDGKTFMEELTSLFSSEQKKQLAERLRIDGGVSEESRLVEWAFSKLKNVKVPYVELCLRQVSTFRNRESETSSSVAQSELDVLLDQMLKAVSSNPRGVYEALKVAKVISDFILKSSSAEADFIRVTSRVLHHARGISSDRPETISSLATIIFSAFRFMPGLAPQTQDSLASLLKSALHSMCELCIPSMQQDDVKQQSYSPQAVTIFAVLVALAGYISPSSMSNINSRFFWLVAKRPSSKTRVPISVTEGWQWLVRTGRLFSQRVSQLECDAGSVQGGQQKLKMELEILCDALRIFLCCAGHSLLVALDRDSGILQLLASLKASTEMAGAASKTSAAGRLGIVCSHLLEKNYSSFLRVMGQEPTVIVSLLDWSYFLTVCDATILTEVAERRKLLATSNVREELDCCKVINQIDVVNLNSEIDREGIWISAFLQKYSLSFKNDGWKHCLGLGGKTLDSYCLNHLCTLFMKKFKQDTFDVKKSSTYILGIMDLCRDQNLEKRMFPFYLKMYFFQRCPILVPVLDLHQVQQLTPAEKKGVAKMVGVFALLVHAHSLLPTICAPFTVADALQWVANLLNSWKRVENRAPEMEELLARCMSEFIRPGGDGGTDGFDSHVWVQIFRKESRFKQVFKSMQELVTRKISSLGSDPSSDPYRVVKDLIKGI